MLTKSEARQKKLFLDTPILKTILIVALPSIVVALMSSLYAFIDQLMMVKFIPSVLTNNEMFGGDYATYIKARTGNEGSISLINVTSVVRTAIAYSAPITVVINAASLLIANGTAVNFSRSSGSTNKDLTKRSWALGFYMNLMFSIIITLLLLALVDTWMKFESGNSLQDSINNLPSTLSEAERNAVISIYTTAFDQTHKFAIQYSYIISAGTIFSMYTSFLSLLIISEGKQTIVTCGAILCNLINILLDYLFIYFGKMAMIGGAIATVIGWGLNAGIYFWYLHYLETKDLTQIHYADLKHIYFTKQLSWSIFSSGLPSLFRNVSIAIAATFQLGLLGQITGILGDGLTNSSFQDIYGAVNPIFNLFFTAELGIIQGSRIVCSYTYGAKNLERFKKTYWYAMSIGFIYGWIMVILLYFALATPLLSIFNITNVDPTKFEYAKEILLISTLQMPVFAFSIGGMMMFQSTGKWIQASACGLMQGVFCNFTISFLMQYFAKHYENIHIFLWNPFIVLAIASLIIFVWSVTYCQLKFKKL